MHVVLDAVDGGFEDRFSAMYLSNEVSVQLSSCLWQVLTQLCQQGSWGGQQGSFQLPRIHPEHPHIILQKTVKAKIEE